MAELNQLDELNELGDLDKLDEISESDELNELGELYEFGELDEFGELGHWCWLVLTDADWTDLLEGSYCPEFETITPTCGATRSGSRDASAPENDISVKYAFNLA